MSDEIVPAPKSTAEDFKEKSPQAIIALTIVLLADLMEDKEWARILKILAPLIALAVVLSITKLTELGIFLFKHFTDKSPKAEKPLDVRLKVYIRENERKLFWMRKSNPDYIELVEHTKLLRKRLRSYELGRLRINVTTPNAASAPAADAPTS
jgi:hypothetical protein